jgi:hypothetical protein
MSALTVGAIATPGTASFDTLTSTLAILIGVLFLLVGALRMGWVAAFIPTPVMRGFIEGLVCVTIVGEGPRLLGIAGTSGNFPQALVRAPASPGCCARAGGDRRAEPRGDTAAPPPGTPSSRRPAECTHNRQAPTPRCDSCNASSPRRRRVPRVLLDWLDASSRTAALDLRRRYLLKHVILCQSSEPRRRMAP